MDTSISHSGSNSPSITSSQRLNISKIRNHGGLTSLESNGVHNGKSANTSGRCDDANEEDNDNEDDDDIDNDIDMFNVPLSQKLASISQRERYTFTNNDRTVESTRSSSLLSQTSISSAVSSDVDDTLKPSPIMPLASGNALTFNVEDLHLSQDARDLTLLFNRNEAVQINEEISQRHRMLSSFQKINITIPPVFPNKLKKGNRSVSNYSIPKLPTGGTPRSVSAPHPGGATSNTPSTSIPTPPTQSSTSISSGPAPTSSKYYSFTRPTWLPPKSSYDKKKHQKESKDLIYLAIQKESEQQKKRLANLEMIKQMKRNDLMEWEQNILPDGATVTEKQYLEKLKSKEVQAMYWRGLPVRLRSRIWYDQIGNALQLSEYTCKYYFGKVEKFLNKVNEFNILLRERMNILQSLKKDRLDRATHGKNGLKLKESEITKRLDDYIEMNPNIIKMKRYYDRLSTDLLDTFPDLNYFQNHDIIEALSKIITSFIIYYNETDQGIELDENKFTNLNLNYYFTGLNNLAGILLFHYKEHFKTFISLCNMFQQNIPSLLLAYRAFAETSTTKPQPTSLRQILGDKSQFTSEQKTTLIKAIYENFFNHFEKDLKKQQNRLFVHFRVTGMKPLDYAPSILLGIFSNMFDFQLSCHVLDVFVFENDKFLRSCLLALLDKISFKLYGSKSESLEILGEQNRKILNRRDGSKSIPESYKYLNVGLEYEFMQKVQEIYSKS